MPSFLVLIGYIVGGNPIQSSWQILQKAWFVFESCQSSRGTGAENAGYTLADT